MDSDGEGIVTGRWVPRTRAKGTLQQSTVWAVGTCTGEVDGEGCERSQRVASAPASQSGTLLAA
eukprot:5029590-Pleurochrysis_carterae.AAC.1